ncbi:hypothetical protein [Crocosphaera watsonii]|uniref:Uncharacterized protein n=1 Tax=Crocosphaera watsonii WH 0401 TaxID=555881 RepID=T2J5V7_CROWT|nr:hypothetical protein CWATWH0401_1171 [Crocosphaera watsonii WH 0401]
MNNKGKWTGYSVDLIYLIHKRLEKRTQSTHKIKLERRDY